MRKLAVFDLDGTILVNDSFKMLIKELVISNPLVLYYSSLRKASIIERERFAEIIHRTLIQKLNDEKFIDFFTDKLLNYLNTNTISRLNYWKTRGVSTLLLSASPNEYVTIFGKKLEFDFVMGSHWSNKKYFHLYGKNKITFINSNYSNEEWDRCYAISDSESDLEFLKLFFEYDLLNK